MRAVLSFLLVFLMASPAFAAAGEWQEAEKSSVRLISATDAVGDLTEYELGVQVKLSPHWHTYWKVPGDTGLPPTFNWSLSENFTDAVITWPAPERIAAFGFENYGYENEVIFPVTYSPARAGEAANIVLDLTLLVCEEICIPEEFTLNLSLPQGAATESAEAKLIQIAQAQVPKEALESIGFGRSWIEKEIITVEIWSENKISSAADIFLETPDFLSFGAPQYEYSAGGKGLRMSLVLNSMLPSGTLDSYAREKGITATFVDGDFAMVAPLEITNPPGVGGADPGFTVILLLAIVGGLILNLMPCVLPVLSLKLLSVVSHGGSVKGKIRAGFLSAAAGIIFSFLVLAAGLIGLKEAGAAIGWGIQFQQPVFLTFMILVLALFAYNLWGLFEISVPKFLASTTPKTHDHEPTLSGHFVTGAFATLLATPCSAPFLGTAIGFALSRGAFEITAVFTALGVGLALPYIAVAVFPDIARLLPRPGHWMITLKKILGLALAATAVWLLFVMAAQIGAYPVSLIGIAMLGLGHLLWHRQSLDTGTIRRMNSISLSGLVLAVFVVAFLVPKTTEVMEIQDSYWVAFDESAIPALVDGGNVVFVDVTADWCLTCKANKKFVLDQDAVESALTGEGVVAMRADWTKPDPEIAAYLESFGRYGIPFNVVYGPSAPAGIPLSELLTSKEVLDALETAR